MPRVFQEMPCSFVISIVLLVWEGAIELTWNASCPTWKAAFLVSFVTFLVWNAIELT